MKMVRMTVMGDMLLSSKSMHSTNSSIILYTWHDLDLGNKIPLFLAILPVISSKRND